MLGTLVRADVVLTAAHCADFLVDEGSDGFGPADLRISFDPEGDAPYSTVDHIGIHAARAGLPTRAAAASCR